MRYGVTIRSLSADVDKHNLPFFLPLATWSGVQPHCFGIWAYVCLMWWKSELYIIHYMLVPSRCDILYEYCTVGIHILLFVILISQAHHPNPCFFWEITTCVEITEGSLCSSVHAILVESDLQTEKRLNSGHATHGSSDALFYLRYFQLHSNKTSFWKCF